MQWRNESLFNKMLGVLDVRKQKNELYYTMH